MPKLPLPSSFQFNSRVLIDDSINQSNLKKKTPKSIRNLKNHYRLQLNNLYRSAQRVSLTSLQDSGETVAAAGEEDSYEHGNRTHS